MGQKDGKNARRGGKWENEYIPKKGERRNDPENIVGTGVTGEATPKSKSFRCFWKEVPYKEGKWASVEIIIDCRGGESREKRGGIPK